MPFVPVPKDLTKVKTKVALNLTKRQIICFSLGAAVGVPMYLLTRKAIGNESAVLLMIGLMLPFFFFAMYEKDGMPLEKILKNFIHATFLSPPLRPYQTNNIYAALARQEKLDREVAELENKTETAKPLPEKKSHTSRKESAKTGENSLKKHSLFPRQ